MKSDFIYFTPDGGIGTKVTEFYNSPEGHAELDHLIDLLGLKEKYKECKITNVKRKNSSNNTTNN